MSRENAGPSLAQPPPLPPSAALAVEQPPVQVAQVAPPVPAARVQSFFWWLRGGKVTRRLGHLLENWQLELRARVAGFSLSIMLHAAIFVVLSLIMIPVIQRTAPSAMDADFTVGVDTEITGTPAGPVNGVVTVVPAPVEGKLAEPPPAKGKDEAVSALTQDEARLPAASDIADSAIVPPPALPTMPGDGSGHRLAMITAGSGMSIGERAGSAANSISPSPGASSADTAARESGNGDGSAMLPRTGGLEGRDPTVRGKMLAKYGGTPQSEAAVSRGLRWLVAHQMSDGSWHFNHQGSGCNGYCPNPGTFASTTGATGLALLPFLGAGHTHLSGPYQDTVRKGLYYLADKLIVSPQGGDLYEGNMYNQGIATLALCEAYALSKDEALRPYAQTAIDFIVHGQDPNGGGWRYMPLSPGDTTVTGWQLMALKSGVLAGLNVPAAAFSGASRFLDGVEADYGAGYGYQKPGRGPTTTAVGVLSRMLTGWQQERPDLVTGVRRLERLGPSKDEMYFNYYAAQALRHNGGQGWNRWNKLLREQLIATQSHDGHTDGSWYMNDSHGEVGGRLYITCMAIMTLEVYYRYMPIYGSRAVDN